MALRAGPDGHEKEATRSKWELSCFAASRWWDLMEIALVVWWASCAVPVLSGARFRLAISGQLRTGTDKGNPTV